jgi:hypothetical protein
VAASMEPHIVGVGSSLPEARRPLSPLLRVTPKQSAGRLGWPLEAMPGVR